MVVVENTRLVEIVGRADRGPFQNLRKGDQFRLFEADGTPVDDGGLCVALEDPFTTEQGVLGVRCDPVTP